MNRTPLLATLLGLAGLLPLLFCGFESLTRAADWALPALIGYGAVTLAFLGAVHWGFALAPATTPSPPQAERLRLTLGTLPALAGWAALLLPRWAGLLVLIAGFIACVVIEAAGHRRALVPSGYMWLRWAHTIIVVAILTTVLVLRLIGATIVL
ncbi:MAG TPA: DUF3429 domain-containing protein [Acetobacteraceae bacterium]|nr:DUF3429 domain-containing protein [Acetobacteraceae bacterium]